jgi:hypothetical protein
MVQYVVGVNHNYYYILLYAFPPVRRGFRWIKQLLRPMPRDLGRGAD